MTQMLRLSMLLAAGAALGFVALTGSGSPRQAFAEDCSPDKTGTLVITIVDLADDNPLAEEGTQVLINPDPKDFVLDQVVVDTSLDDANAGADRDPDPGVIRYEDACSTEGNEFYKATLWSLPDELSDCDIQSDVDTTTLAPGETEHLTLEVDCTGVGPTATPVPTATAGPANAVTVLPSTLTVSCSGTSVITVQVRDSQGQPVAAGVPVAITSDIGVISPSSGVETAETGNAFAFFTSPATTGGTATITATANGHSGTGKVTVACGTAASATVAPPPTISTGTSSGLITPPNTGDAGLAAPRHAQPALLWLVAGLCLVTGWHFLGRFRRV